jgi:tetratricopeptide (TPR) repeat protein
MIPELRQETPQPIAHAIQDAMPQFSPGEVILNRFEIVRFLGSGGMGEVFAANDLELACPVALKTIRLAVASDPKALPRFKHEVQMARRITGPFVCRIHELYLIPPHAPHGPLAFLSMEFLEGMTLADHLHQRGPMPWREAEPIVRQLCQGLQCVHDADVVHRDLKSRNIMLVERNGTRQAVVMDFGLAQETIDETDRTRLALTQSGAIIGTPAYMAPEQFEGGPVSAATYVYALGIVLYELVTGTHPFDADNAVAAALRRAKRPPKASSIQHGLPKRWDHVIERCLEYDADRRFQSANQVAEALLQHSFSVARVPKQVSGISRRHGWMLILGLLVAIACGVVLFWAMFHGYNAPPADAMRWYNEGVGALREGTYVKATRALEAAVSRDRDFALAHARLADAWSELDFTGKAEHEMLLASAPDQRLPKLDREYLEALRATLTHDYAGAVRLYSQIVQDSPSEDRASAYLDLGRAYEKHSEIDAALRNYAKARDLAPDYPAAYTRLGILESRKGDVKQGEKDFDSAERIYRMSSNFEGLAELDFQRAYTATTSGRLAEARKAAQESLKLAEQIGSVQLQIRALGRLAAIEYLSQNYDHSIELANRAIKLAQDTRNEYWAVDGLLRLGSTYLKQRQYDQAETIFQRALKLAEQAEMPRAKANLELSLASIRAQQRKPKELIPLAESALAYYRANGFSTEMQAALGLLIEARIEQNDLKGALSSAQDLLLVAKRSGNPVSILNAESQVAENAFMLGRYPEALIHYKRSFDLSRELGQQVDEQSLHYAAALWHLGRYPEAEELVARVGRPLAPYADSMMAEIRLSQHRWLDATRLASRALKQIPPEDSGTVKITLALAGLHSGDKKQPKLLCKSVLESANRDQDREMAAEASMALATILIAERDWDAAKLLAESALHVFEAAGEQESQWFALHYLTLITAAKGDHENSRKFAERSLRLLSELEHSWDNSLVQSYIRRPDVSEAKTDLERIVQGGVG